MRSALSRATWLDPWRLPLFLLSRLSQATGHRLPCKLPRHAKAILAKELFPPEFFASLFKFTFVRNPWDLQVSSYHHLLRERAHLVAPHKDFKAFLEYKLDPARPPQYHLDVSSTPQVECLMDFDGKLLVDFVGRYERLQEDFSFVCAKVGLKAIPLPEKRRAKDRASYQGYYDDESARWVAERYARDIEVFGYTFDNQG
mgnify:CR=1 FL=1